MILSKESASQSSSTVLQGVLLAMLRPVSPAPIKAIIPMETLANRNVAMESQWDSKLVTMAIYSAMMAAVKLAKLKLDSIV